MSGLVAQLPLSLNSTVFPEPMAMHGFPQNCTIFRFFSPLGCDGKKFEKDQTKKTREIK